MTTRGAVCRIGKDTLDELDIGYVTVRALAARAGFRLHRADVQTRSRADLGRDHPATTLPTPAADHESRLEELPREEDGPR
jgi:hypothetical protein